MLTHGLLLLRFVLSLTSCLCINYCDCIITPQFSIALWAVAIIPDDVPVLGPVIVVLVIDMLRRLATAVEGDFRT